MLPAEAAGTEAAGMRQVIAGNQAEVQCQLAADYSVVAGSPQEVAAPGSPGSQGVAAWRHQWALRHWALVAYLDRAGIRNREQMARRRAARDLGTHLMCS